ncbi:unnamed protein product [Darwinula stevensoni]|uniref:Uncharacterized protein n=1 Tax=Darwinula stevensoni TaxID=69355 RepID=A0A7R9A1D9_9CRUS|nr:unnamed protein product [Darwinula stevensoni]CAG0887528.1 unnamed protein product [Darwinula stevensoni]
MLARRVFLPLKTKQVFNNGTPENNRLVVSSAFFLASCGFCISMFSVKQLVETSTAAASHPLQRLFGSSNRPSMP